MKINHRNTNIGSTTDEPTNSIKFLPFLKDPPSKLLKFDKEIENIYVKSCCVR